MAKIPSTSHVEDAVLYLPVREETYGVLRLPRVILEEKRDPVTGEVLRWNGRPIIQGRGQTIEEWQAENDPEGQQARLMDEVRN
jgi:hypothetical protein